MNKETKIIIILFFGLCLVYVLPVAIVDAAKLESGVTITSSTTTETEKICDDQKDNDNDGRMDLDDEDCAVQSDQCGLQIQGVPINYGQLELGQVSAIHDVSLLNEGNNPVVLFIRGGSWISDSIDHSSMSGPDITQFRFGANWMPLQITPSLLGDLAPHATYGISFQLKVPNSGLIGSLHQEITITC